MSLDVHRNNYIASNVNTDKKIIIDASMSCTRHTLWNILSLLTIANGKPILIIIPDKLAKFYYEELNIMINSLFPVIAITHIAKEQFFYKMHSPTADVTMISLSNLRRYTLYGKPVSPAFEHFMFKGHLPPSGKIKLGQKPPNASGITLFLLKKLFVNAEKVIIDIVPCSDSVVISSLYEIAEFMGITDTELPWLDSDFFHINTELSAHKVLHHNMMDVPLKVHTQSPIDPERFR